MNTADYLLQFGDDDRPALISGDEQHTYRELESAARRVARELVALGVGPRDRVGIVAINSPFWVAAYLAVMKLGAVAVPLNPGSTAASLATLMRFVDCRAVCLQRAYRRRLAAVLPKGVPTLDEGILAEPGLTAKGWETMGTTPDEDEDAALMCTSGTTAEPRVVRVTHRNIQANTESIIASLGLTSGERVLVVLPFFYCFGTSLLHTHLRVGGSLVLCNTFAYPETALDAMQATHCTGFAGVPSVYQALLRNSTFRRRALPDLRKVQQAGGKLHTVLIRELLDAVPQAEVFIMYGQTEATARLSCLSPLLLPAKIGSIGRGIPGVELRVVGENGVRVKPGEVGEVIARGDNITPGYLNNPQATATKIVDGALRTGDLATVDDDGLLYIVDRKADFIKTYGYRVSSQEVEECLLALPDTVAAAVIGVPDLTRGEAIKAYVTIRAGAALSPDEILVHCKRQLPRYMWPVEVSIVDALPLNAHGKVVKPALRRAVEAGVAPGAHSE